MSLLDTILIGLILFLPFFLIVILPFILAYIYGSKALVKVREVYSKAITGAAKRVFGKNAKVSIDGSSDRLTLLFEVKDGILNFSGEISLIERRTYAYYFAKMFGGIPDTIFLKCDLQKTPAALLYLISKKRKRLIEKSSKVLYALDEVNLGKLNRHVLAFSDNPRSAIKYFTEKLLKSFWEILDDLNFMIVDISSPNIEISLQITEKKIGNIVNAFKLIKELSDSVSRVKGKASDTSVLKYVKKFLKS